MVQTHKKHFLSSPGKYPFTMIELLAVMVVLMLLISWILPAILRMKEKGQRTYCMNNLRQIGLASQTYIDEYDQYVMPGKFGTTLGSGDYNHWINYLFEEKIPSASLFQCPTLSKDDYFNPSGGKNKITEASYVRNIIDPGKWAGAAISSSPGKSWGWGSTTSYIQIQEVRHPSEKINVLDVIAGGVASTHSGIRHFQETDHGIINVVPLAGFRRVGYHHRLGFNVLMGDGHVEYMVHTFPDQWVVVVR